MAEDLLPLMGHNMDEESDSEEDQAQEIQNVQPPSEVPDINFDPSLPGAHSYLGSDLEDVRGRTVHEDDTHISLPILSLPGVVLVPGQTLPLHLFQPTMVSMMRHVVDQDKTFGLVTARYSETDRIPSLATFGTTAEIFSIKEESDDRVGLSTMRVKAMGRQRFEIIDTRRQSDGVLIAQARILPERVLTDCLVGARPPSHNKYCHRVEEPEMPSGAGDGSVDMAAMMKSFFAKKPNRYDKFTAANLTWWPPWVYKQYDVYAIMAKVKKELHSWNETLKPENMPRDPTEFSFWVAGNLPLDDSLKLHLLRIDSAVQRLRCELSIMQRCTVLCCKDCGQLIANKKDVFSMALEGPLGAYVNPGGYVHETLTVYKAQGLSLVGRPSTENSWFPGYAWTVIDCQHCSKHMGWKFTATKRKLKPEKFWGLCRSSLLPGLQSEENSEETSSWLPIM